MTLLRKLACAGVSGAALLLAASPAAAVVTVHQGAAGLTTFNTLGGNPPVTISFDSLTGNIAGATIQGVTFSSPSSNTLDVVTGSSTFTPGGFGGVINASTNVLIPTSGERVLSPGGSELVPGSQLRERDSLRLDFTSPLSAFGLDILFQSFDCCSFTSYQVFTGSTSISGGINGGGGGGGQPAATQFFGVTSTAADITAIVFTESDGDATFPDSNIGYDSFRFAAPVAVVPEPAAWAMLISGFGLAGAALRRRKTVIA